MRNTKIALAVLALVASTAAMAEGVSVYGTVDANVSQVDGGKATFGGLGSWAGNIMGVNASQDLDNGMKASADFELGYNLGTGNNGANGGISSANTVTNVDGNPFFNRKANVALSGDFGTVTAGLQITPFIPAAIGGSSITNNQSFYVTSLGLAGAGVNGGSGSAATPVTGGFFIPNSVQYATPSIGGFSAKVLGQVTSATSNTNDTNDNKYMAYAGTYAAGDITVNAGYQKRDGTFGAGTTAAPGLNYTSMTVSGSYAMGATTLGAGYISHDLNTTASASTKVNVFYGLVAHKVSDALIASLGYAQNNAATKGTMLNIGLQYNLNSKGTTFLYATGGQGSKTAQGPIYGGQAGDATGNTKGYAVGIVKSF
jgi:predicted porin